MQFRLGKLRWWFRYSRKLKATHGYISDRNARRREIVVGSRQSELNILDTTIHEMIHACDDGEMLDEAWVRNSATDIARALHRLGWRLTTKPIPSS